MKRCRLWISGRVQGVFFRAHTRKTAVSLGLQGWVRNLPDGRVETVAEGEDRDVDALIAWCRQGPPRSRVDSVTVRDEPFLGEEPAFVIRQD